MGDPKKEADDLFDAESPDALFDMAGNPPRAPTPAPQPPQGDASIPTAIARGAAQGVSLGFADEALGLARGIPAGFLRQGAEAMKSTPGRLLLRKAMGLPDATSDEGVDAMTEGIAQESNRLATGDKTLPMDPDAALTQGYRSGRNEARLMDVQSAKAHPLISPLSAIGGAMLVGGPKSGTSKLQRAKVGAGMGAAMAAGSSTADLTADDEAQSLLNLAGDTALGGAVGGVLNPIMGAVGDKLTPVLKRMAQKFALRSFGQETGASPGLLAREYESPQEAMQLGQGALDQGLIRPFRTASDVAERARLAKPAVGSRISSVLERADAPTPVPGVEGATFPAEPFDFPRASRDAAASAMGPRGLTTAAMSKARPAASIVEQILRQGELDSSFSAANKLKSDIYGGINYKADPSLTVKLQRGVASGLRGSIEDQVGERLGAPAAAELKAANQAYGQLSDIQPLAQDAAASQARGLSMDPRRLLQALGERTPSAIAVGANRVNAPASLMRAGQVGMQSVLRPSLEERERDSIEAFLSGM